LNDWINRKKKEFATFDLSSLTAVGWLLFLISIAVPIMVLAIIVIGPLPPGQVVPERTTKIYGTAMLLAMVGMYQGGKFLTEKAGLRVYRSKKQGNKNTDG
jgi:hypothetical protein